MPFIKALLIGDSECGKTTFLNRHSSGKFTSEEKGIRQVEFYTSNGKITFEFYVMMPSEVKDCIGEVEVVFYMVDGTLDLTSQDSRDNLISKIRTVHSEINSRLSDSTESDSIKFKSTVPFYILWNKADCKEWRPVPNAVRKELKKLSIIGGQTPILAMSSKSNYNFEKPFLYSMRLLLNNQKLRYVEAPSVKKEDGNDGGDGWE